VVQRLLKAVSSLSANVPENHEALFVSRYRMLYTFARRLADGDSDAADDLLHDAYVQFLATRPALATIEQPDAYLIALLRNLRVSGLRRKANQHQLHVGIEEYDSAERALERASVHQRLATREALLLVCAYACRRKETSKGASVLVLRYFHGFYPTEIERILRAPARTVSRLLSHARAEARLVLAHPERLQALGPCGGTDFSLPALDADDPREILRALRSAIFETGQPPCPGLAAIRGWYVHKRVTLKTPALAHLVGCARCLAHVCTTLGVPPLDERSPTDPPDGSPVDGPGSGAAAAPLRKARQRGLPDLLEHHPKELQVSVNGLPLGLLRVASAENRVRWTVRVDEPLAFAELHSEQDVRMLLLTLVAPAHGTLVQRVRAVLTNDRWIQMTVDFSELHPAITVEYVDPTLVPRQVQAPSHGPVAVDAPERATACVPGERPVPRSLRPSFADWWRLPARLVPAIAALAFVVAGAWWLARQQVGSAAVVEQAVAKETALANQQDRVAHRTLRLEIRRADTGAIETDHRVESWLRRDPPLRAIRVFDRDGDLVAARWTGADRQETRLESSGLADVWTMDVSASAFRDRFMVIAECSTSTEPAVYVVTCARPARNALLESLVPVAFAQVVSTEPWRAALTLRRSDLHAVRLALEMRLGGADKQVILEERSLEHVPVSDVPAAVFIPDAPRRSTTAPPAPSVARPRADIRSLEMQLLEMVDRLPDSEYLSIVRTAANRLSITGLVSTHGQKRSLLEAVTALDEVGAVATDVYTFAEAAARDLRVNGRTRTEPTRVEFRAPAAGPAPIEGYLRMRLPSGTDVAALARELTPRVLTEARRARRNAVTLGVLIGRVPDHVRAVLDVRGREAWRLLVSRRIADCRAALEALDSELAPYFGDGIAAATSTGTGDLVSSASHDIGAAIRRLGDETQAVEEALTLVFSAAGVQPVESAVPVDLDVRRRVHRALIEVRAVEARTRP
jgi:RNA polymerase sigma factor (sigma-70 family)